MKNVRTIYIIFIYLILVNICSVSAENGWKFLSNLENTGEYDDGAVHIANHLLWKYDTDKKILSSPAISDGVVYFGSDTNKTYALNAKTGEKIWDFETGGQIWSSPAIFNGVAYFGSKDHKFYALNAKTGEMVWNFETGDQIVSSPTIFNEVVYFGSHDHKFYALDAKTGEMVWNFETENVIHSSPAISDGVVYFGSYDNKLYGLDSKTGNIIFECKVGEVAGVYGSPVVSNNIIFIVTKNGYLCAINKKTGDIMWRKNIYMKYFGAPAVFNEIVYSGNAEHKLSAIDAKSGDELWNYKVSSNILSDPIISDNKVYFGTISGNVYALDAKTGNELWIYESNITSGSYNFLLSSPAISDGVLYWGTDYFNDSGEITSGLIALGNPASKSLNSDAPTIEPSATTTSEPDELFSEFSFNQNPKTAPMEVSFTDQSTGNPTSWLWDFGDGTTDYIQNPTHVYESKGTYYVSLTVSDGDTIAIPTKKQVTVINANSQSSQSDTTHLISNSLPDLTITSSSMFYNPDSSSISINLTIENKGGTNPGKFYLTYFLTDTKTNHPLMYTDTKEIILDRDDVNGLEPGEIRNKNSAKTLPIDKSQISSRTYWFGIAIDSRNEIDESDEENNVLYGPEPLHL